MGEIIACIREKINACNISIRIHEKKPLLGTPSHTLKNNIKMDLEYKSYMKI
jgi:hypothetical protein